MNTLRFGVEIETIGQTREVVARAIQSVVGGEVRHVGTPFWAHGFGLGPLGDAPGR